MSIFQAFVAGCALVALVTMALRLVYLGALVLAARGNGGRDAVDRLVHEVTLAAAAILASGLLLHITANA